MKKINLLKLLPIIMFCSQVQASVMLTASMAVLDFPSSKKHQHFTLTNTGNEKAFIKLTVDRMTSSGKSSSNNSGNSKDILTVPKKLILKPGQSRKIKVIKKVKPDSQDKFYRIFSSTAPMPSKSKELKDKKAVGVKLHVGVALIL